LFVFKCKECNIESKNKKGFIPQAFDGATLRFKNIEAIALTKNNSPKLHVNLFLIFKITISKPITNIELLLIGPSVNNQKIIFKIKLNVRMKVRILVVIF
jgi:hypothetical protein